MSAMIRGISEDDFGALAEAANNAMDRGDMEHAKRLDVLARKANAALARGSVRLLPGMRVASINWREVPSVLLTDQGRAGEWE